MDLSKELCQRLGIALNEADLLGLALEENGREATITVRVLTLPEKGPEPVDRVRLLRCSPVARVAASLRHGRWDDEAATVEPVTLYQLGDLVGSAVSQIYGWQFIDPPDASWNKWRRRLSLDVRFDHEARHVIEMFHGLEKPERHLDFRIWFEDLAVFTSALEPVSLEGFAAGGERWWDALHAGDRRTLGHGIMPLKHPLS